MSRHILGYEGVVPKSSRYNGSKSASPRISATGLAGADCDPGSGMRPIQVGKGFARTVIEPGGVEFQWESPNLAATGAKYATERAAAHGDGMGAAVEDGGDPWEDPVLTARLDGRITAESNRHGEDVGSRIRQASDWNRDVEPGALVTLPYGTGGRTHGQAYLDKEGVPTVHVTTSSGSGPYPLTEVKAT